MPSVFVGIDNEGTHRGIACLQVNTFGGVFSETGMRNQQFPVIQSQVVEDIAVCDLYEKLTGVLRGELEPMPLKEIDDKVQSYQRRYTVRRLTSTGWTCKSAYNRWEHSSNFPDV